MIALGHVLIGKFYLYIAPIKDVNPLDWYQHFEQEYFDLLVTEKMSDVYNDVSMLDKRFETFAPKQPPKYELGKNPTPEQQAKANSLARAQSEYDWFTSYKGLLKQGIYVTRWRLRRDQVEQLIALLQTL
jgi:hypothetical protein